VSNQHAELEVPLAPLDLPAPDSVPTDSLLIAVVDELAHRARIILPPTVTSRLPAAVTLTRDYATYRSGAERRGDTLLVERSLTFARRGAAGRSRGGLSILPEHRAGRRKAGDFLDALRGMRPATPAATAGRCGRATPARDGGPGRE